VQILIAAAIVAAAILIAARMAAVRPSSAADDAFKTRQLQLLSLFAPGICSAADDPRALLAWQPLAVTARRLFADEFAGLDRAAGSTFPFSRAQLDAAHARWSAEWLMWEQAHDAEYKLKASAAEEELRSAGGSTVARARLDNIEREKLERYQRRYEQYTRVSKALKNLVADVK
jgi:hypothetical protein